MKLNGKQAHALEGIYQAARIYTKIAAKLNEIADTIELESETVSYTHLHLFIG